MPPAPPSYTYDDADNLLSVTTAFADMTPAQNKTISYTYYPDGSRATMTVPIPGGTGTFRYQYDAAGRPVALTNPFG